MKYVLLAAIAFAVLPVANADAYGGGLFRRQRQQVVVKQVVVKQAFAVPVVQHFVAPVVVAQPVVTQAIVAPVHFGGYGQSVIQQRAVISGGCNAFFAY